MCVRERESVCVAGIKHVVGKSLFLKALGIGPEFITGGIPSDTAEHRLSLFPERMESQPRCAHDFTTCE